MFMTVLSWDILKNGLCILGCPMFRLPDHPGDFLEWGYLLKCLVKIVNINGYYTVIMMVIWSFPENKNLLAAAW